MLLGKRLYSLFMFVAVSILAGVLAAGLLVPIVGIAATGGRDALVGVGDLPTELETPPQAQRSKLLDVNGHVLAYFYNQNRVYVPLSKISPIMQQTQVAIEDTRFFQHGALDLAGTLRALVRTSQGNAQGGSTLTQQYVRMVLVDNAIRSGDLQAAAEARANTLARKIRELRYAIAVEKEFSKNQILEDYLNMAYYGDGAYGVEAAAQHYFGISAAKLDLAQSAMLAGLVQNPVTTNPVTHPAEGISRRNDVLNRLATLKLITEAQATQAKAVPFDKSKVKDSYTGCANSNFPFLCDYALRTMLNNTPSLGATKADRKDMIYRGGLTIKTNIDPSVQKLAEKRIAKVVSPTDRVISTVVMLEPGTGLIRAMAQSRPEMGSKKGQTYYNYAVGRSMGMGGYSGFQGGSTFKTFVAAAALEEGFGTNFTYNVPLRKNWQGETFKNCSGPFVQSQKWEVDGPERGSYNLLNGTAKSVNNYFAALEQAVGMCPVVNLAVAAGLQMADGSNIVKNYQWLPSFTLGSAEVTPLSLVNAYATFANRGVRCNPVILKSITTSDGTAEAVPSANCQVATNGGYTISPDVADGVNKVLQGPISYGTLTGAQIPGYTLAGKTGTVPDNKSEWAIAYTPDLVTGTMISVDNSPKNTKFWQSHRRNLEYLRLKTGVVLSGFGADVGKRVLRPVMAAALADLPKHTQFNPPSTAVMQGESVSVPSCSGMGVSSCQAALQAAGFSVRVTKVYDDSSAGTFLYSYPHGEAVQGSLITLVISKGPQPAAPSSSASPPATEPPKPKR